MKKIKYLVVVALFSLVSNIAISQDSLHNDVDILPNQIYNPSGSFIINNKLICNHNLVNYLKTNSTAYSIYRQSQRRESAGQTLMVIGLFSLIGSAITINNDNHLSGKLAIGSLVTFISGGGFVSSSHKKLNKAICAYNSTH
jgi:hypothetical protein